MRSVGPRDDGLACRRDGPGLGQGDEVGENSGAQEFHRVGWSVSVSILGVLAFLEKYRLWVDLEGATNLLCCMMEDLSSRRTRMVLNMQESGNIQSYRVVLCSSFCRMDVCANGRKSRSQVADLPLYFYKLVVRVHASNSQDRGS